MHEAEDQIIWPDNHRKGRVWLPDVPNVLWGPEPMAGFADHAGVVPNGHIPYTLRGTGARLVTEIPNAPDWTRSMNRDFVYAVLSKPDAFMQVCHILNEGTEQVDYADPTAAQRAVFAAIHAYRWIMIDKYRQAKMTTAAAMWLLRDCMLFEGINGLLIANDEPTAKMAFERIRLAYNKLEESGIQVPLDAGRKGSATELHFVHGGSIKIVSAQSHAPAVGHSIDRMVITEFGEALWQRRASINIFPTIGKRPFGRVWLESTPGRDTSYFRGMWQSAMAGTSNFFGVFLRWWFDE